MSIEVVLATTVPSSGVLVSTSMVGAVSTCCCSEKKAGWLVFTLLLLYHSIMAHLSKKKLLKRRERQFRAENSIAFSGGGCRVLHLTRHFTLHWFISLPCFRQRQAIFYIFKKTYGRNWQCKLCSWLSMVMTSARGGRHVRQCFWAKRRTNAQTPVASFSLMMCFKFVPRVRHGLYAKASNFMAPPLMSSAVAIKMLIILFLMPSSSLYDPLFGQGPSAPHDLACCYSLHLHLYQLQFICS